MYYLDDYLKAKVNDAADLLHDGKYLESRKAIDAVFFMIGAKNIMERKFPDSVSFSTLLNLLTMRANIYLSFHDYKTADSMLAMTDFFTKGLLLPPYIQVKIMVLKSNVMVMPNPVEHSLQILSEALKIAEGAGDEMLILEVYMEMGKFMANEYTALGLSLIRKVETYFKRNQMKEGEIGAKIYRSRSSFMLGCSDKYKWVKDRERFSKEAEKILNSIIPKDIKLQFNRDLYWKLKRDIEQYKQAKINGN